MSDYFSYLARMALGTVPSLAPRPASRFDPAATMEIAPAPDTPDDMAMPVEPFSRPAELRYMEADEVEAQEPPLAPAKPVAPPASASFRLHRERREPVPAVHTIREDTSEPSPTLPRSRGTTTTGAVADHASAADVEHEPPAVRPTRQAVMSGTRFRSERSTPAETGLLEPGASAPHEAASTEPGSRPAEDDAHGERPDRHDVTPVDDGERALSPDAIPPRQESFVVAAESSQAAWADRPIPRRTPPPPPTIQVTIGRVEVRAVQPPAPAPPAPPAARPPGLTLDDYLAARDRGSS